MRRRTFFDHVMLILVLALAFYIAVIPHLSSPYPVHIDEWLHMANAKAVQTAESTTYLDPFTGTMMFNPGINLETGFLAFWGVFQNISGLSWFTIIRWFPAIFFMITVLCIYILGRREGYGWEAAFFAALVPTTVGILGPGFFVPVAFALPVIPLSLFLVFNYRTWWSYLLLFFFTCFLLWVHAATAVGLAIILTPYVLLNLRSDFKRSLGVVLALSVPFLGPLPWIFQMLLPTAKQLLTPQAVPAYVDIPMIISHYGYLPIVLSLVGCFLLLWRGGNNNYSLVLGLLALLVMLATFFSFHYGVEIMYERGLLYLMLMLSIMAGRGLAAVRAIRLPTNLVGKIPPLLARNVGPALCLALVGITLAVAIPNHQNTPYYHMIDEEDYQAFAWIRDNINDSYERAILDPWKATAFVAITGKSVYTRIHVSPLPPDSEAYRFLDSGSSDTVFLRDNKVSIVYTRDAVDNPDLVEVRENVYLLR